MAVTSGWDGAIQRFRYLQRLSRLEPTVAAMLRLISSLREDPRLGCVLPSVSLASLNLKLSDCTRYVTVARHETEGNGFEISFVDPPLEFSQTKIVSEDNAVAMIVEYLDGLQRQ